MIELNFNLLTRWFLYFYVLLLTTHYIIQFNHYIYYYNVLLTYSLYNKLWVF